VKVPALVNTGTIARSQLKPLSKTPVSYKTVEVVEWSVKENSLAPLDEVIPNYSYIPKSCTPSIMVAKYKHNGGTGDPGRKYSHLIDIYI
jgi:hypothetical protein